LRTDRDLLTALLLWDRRTLLSAGRRDVSALLELFDLRQPDQIETLEQEFSESPFSVLAVGLLAELNGSQEVAVEKYAQLAEAVDPLTRLVGVLFIAWRSDASIQDFERVEQEMRNHPQVLQARIYAKLVAWSLDQGYREKTLSYVDQGISMAEGDLRQLLVISKSRLSGTWSVPGNPINDPLVLHPYMHTRLGELAMASEEKSLIESAVGPRRRTITFGAVSSANKIKALEMQALWAGALLVLPEIRRMGGIVLLQSKNEADVAEGLTQWILGSGKDIQRLISSRESLFNEGTADYILRVNLKDGSRLWRPFPYIQACLGFWDQMPEQMVSKTINTIWITDDVLQATHDDGVRLFDLLLVRDPASWWSRFITLNIAQQLSVVVRLAPEAVDHLPVAAQTEVMQVLTQALAQKDVQFNAPMAWRTFAKVMSFQTPEARREYADLLNRMPDSEVVAVYNTYPGLITESKLDAAALYLKNIVQGDIEAARRGVFAGYNYDPRSRYAHTLAALGHVSAADVEPLRATLESAFVSRGQKYEAIRAITILAASENTDIRQTSLIPRRDAISETNSFAMDGISDHEFESALTIMYAFSELTPETEGNLLSLVRDEDPRVREMALDAAISIGRQRRSVAIDSAILGGLYDPWEDMQVRSILAVGAGVIKDPSLERAAWDAIHKIWSSSSRHVRAAIASISHSSKASDIAEMVKSDRSWIVRMNGKR
jgi:hypothetical protein